MPNKPKQTATKDRRAKLEELRRQQARQERRKTLLFVGIAAVVALGIVAAAAVPIIRNYLNDPARQSITAFGVAAASAQCDPEQSQPATGGGQHVGPGTKRGDVTRVKYATVPPTFGEHFVTPAPFDRKFYTADDRPPMEQLVHNLEHGYTVVWYDDTIKGQDLQDLKDLADKLGKQRSTQFIIVSAWDPSYGAFPAGKHIGMSHWGADDNGNNQVGYRQMCGKVSGQAIEAFAKKHPKRQSPEPNAG